MTLSPPPVDLDDGRCLVWTVPLKTAAQGLPLAELDPVERDRLASYRRPEDRDRFALGSVMVRRLVADRLGIKPADVVLDRTCEVCGKPHGRIRVVGPERPPQVSVSHSGDLVVAAVHRDVPIGVDVERVDPAIDVEALARVVLADEEIAVLRRLADDLRVEGFTTYWTRKEAVLKATGDGMRADPRRLVMAPPYDTARVLGWGDGDRPRWVHVQDVPTAAGHVAALANLGGGPVKVSTGWAATRRSGRRSGRP